MQFDKKVMVTICLFIVKIYVFAKHSETSIDSDVYDSGQCSFFSEDLKDKVLSKQDQRVLDDESSDFCFLDEILSQIFQEQEEHSQSQIDSINTKEQSSDRRNYAIDFIKNREDLYATRRAQSEQKKIDVDICSQTNLRVDPQRGFIPIDTIVLDAGHGGKDCGSVRHGIMEKNLALILVKKIHMMFRKSNSNIKIYVTRKNDQFVSLQSRVSKTARWSVNNNVLFVSIHGNSARNVKAEGIEIYTVSDKASDSDALSTERLENAGFSLEDIEKTDSIFSLLADLIRDSTRKQSTWLARYVYDHTMYTAKSSGRGIKQARFFLLRYNTVPSILVEVGFLSNVKEAKKLKSEEYQSKLATGIFRGLSRYITEYNKTEGFTK